MVKIYHNTRCSKSREVLQILENKGVTYTIIKYLDNPLSFEELKDILRMLGINPIELVRKKEEIWENSFSGKTLGDNEIIEAMVQYPKLIERPIVVNNDKAVIARPASNLDRIF